jgi:nitrate reductase gamma subunit
MRDLINYLLFGWYPYISLSLFLLGGWLRFGGERHIRASESGQLLWRPLLSCDVGLFHGGILILLLGHFIGLLTPIQAFDAVGVTHAFKQWMAVVIGGTAGAVSLVGLGSLLRRRVTEVRNGPTSSFSDRAILPLIAAQLVLGLATVPVALVKYRDGCGILEFMAWAQDIAAMKPAAAAAQVVDAPLIFKLHMLNGMTIFLALPFTRLVNIWSVAVWCLGRRRSPLQPQPGAAE